MSSPIQDKIKMKQWNTRHLLRYFWKSLSLKMYIDVVNQNIFIMPLWRAYRCVAWCVLNITLLSSEFSKNTNLFALYKSVIYLTYEATVYSIRYYYLATVIIDSCHIWYPNQHIFTIRVVFSFECHSVLFMDKTVRHIKVLLWRQFLFLSRLSPYLY